MSYTIDDLLGDSEAMLLEPREIYDAAFLGVATRVDGLHVAAYDTAKCIEALMQHYEFDREEAQEWFDCNTSGAYVGPGTPVFIDLLPRV